MNVFPASAARRRPPIFRRLRVMLLIALGALAGCEQLGIEDPATTNARVEAEGKAIGSACRHAGRAIEDCYAINPVAPKAAIFAGWKEMNDYMKDNSLDEVKPQVAPNGPPPPPAPPRKKRNKSDDGNGHDAPAASEKPADDHKSG